MKLLKPNWVSHGGNPIYSVSIHPDGTRLATGGQGDDTGIVILWNTQPIKSESAEHDPGVPKVLCELTNHLGCVNCVKWSNSGQWLASSGDDAIVMLWSLRSKGVSAPAFGSKNPSHEQWGCGHMLRGHSGDVLDISWSNDDRYLASASVDNSIIVWNGLKFPEQLVCLSNHTGLVKGLTWDPVGRYMASQSDDRSVRIWRTTDWKEESKITQPFTNCGGTTQMLRLSWSPDGRFIVSAHSLNNDGPTAHIIERNSWKTGMDFVGHRKAIEVVSFNPQLFVSNDGNQGCIAIGSRDRSVSVWLTTCKRPLVVIHDLFNNSVIDLAWSKDGYSLMACSLDGTVAYLSFTEQELGVQLKKEDINEMFLDLYGTRRFTMGRSIDQPSDLLVEDPALLMKRDNTVIISKQTTPTFTPSKDITDQKQVETRTKDGRRRIKPITLTTIESAGVDQVFTTPPQSSSTPQRNDSLLTAVVDKQAPSTKATSITPLSPDHTKEQSLSAAKSIITTKRPQPESAQENTSKPKRIKKTSKDTSSSSTSHKAQAQPAWSGCISNEYLPQPTSQACLSAEVTSSTITCTVEVNNSSTGDCSVSGVQDGRPLWSTSYMSIAVNSVSASSYVTCVGFEDHSVMFLSTLTGRTLFPRIVMKAPIYSIIVSSYFVAIATVDASYTVYNISSLTCLLNNVSFAHLFQDVNDLVKLSITEDGLPVVITDHHIYCYNTGMMSWVTMATNNESPMVRSSKFALSSTSITQLTPLRSLQLMGVSSSFTSSTIPSRDATLTYLESQISRSLTLHSLIEYQHWVKCYIRYLVSDAMEDRLREFMQSLQSGAATAGPMFILDCLNIISTNTKLQRLYCELRDGIKH